MVFLSAFTEGEMSVKSAGRVLDIIELMSSRRRGLSVTEISYDLGFPISSTHALLRTLVERSYLMLDPVSRTYSLGARLFEIGSRYIEQVSLVDVVGEPMRRLRDRCDETISLGVLDGEGVIIVRKNESSRALRIGNPLGTRLPVDVSAMGKAILACWPVPDLIRFLEGVSPHRDKRATKADRHRLLQELEGIRQSGIAYDLEESTEGVCAVAAAIDEGEDPPRASIAIVVPSVRATGEPWEQLPSLLLSCVREIESGLMRSSSNAG